MADGFGFASPDYALRAQAGLPLDPNAPDQSVMPAAPQATLPALPQAAPWKPSVVDTVLDFMNGTMPADSAAHQRELHLKQMQQDYAVRNMQTVAKILPTLPAPLQAAAMMGGPKVWEDISKNYSPQTRSAGQQTDYMGGAPSGGYTNSTDTYGVDDKSGKPFASGPGGGFRTLAPSLGGDFSAKDGVVASGRTGDVANTYSLPQIVPAGSGPGSFTPSVGGQGGNTPPSRGLAPSAASSGASGPLIGPDGSLDPTAFFHAFVMPHEGGLNPRDLNGSPTKYGINQKANPDVDVKKLGPDDAAGIFASKYFANSGAAHLPPALAAVQADTAFINPKKAAEFLVQSGGDPAKYMDLREAWMNGMVSKYPAAAKYADAWTRRNADLRVVAGQLGAQGGAAQAPGAAGWQGGQPRRPRTLSPEEATALGFAPGSVVEQDPTGRNTVSQPPEYSPSERSKIREQFLSSEPYKQHTSAASALQALQHNIGQMTGPAAYTLLDTMARTINPGAVARQGTIAAIEQMMGPQAHIVGTLLNFQGKGSIPLKTQQQILDAVTPFAQAHYDQAKRFYDANVAIANKHKFDPDEVVAPIGNRPEHMSVTVPPPAQRAAGLFLTPKGPMHWDGKLWHPAD